MNSSARAAGAPAACRRCNGSGLIDEARPGCIPSVLKVQARCPACGGSGRAGEVRMPRRYVAPDAGLQRLQESVRKLRALNDARRQR